MTEPVPIKDPAIDDAMRTARQLGESVLGATSPNPPVGAVVLDAHGAVVGRGATAPAGGPHAEVLALAQAGERARGGTAVTTLEPCAHTGRTGPCTEALRAAGIARVVYAVPDPTPVAGGGGAALTRAGVDVLAGLHRAEAERGALRGWLHAVTRGRPFVTWKYAATLDGRVAAADGSSRWITGPAARADVHRWRARHDAVLVGAGTVRADDPQLTVRHEDGTPADRQPLRVVLARSTPLPDGARVGDGAAPTVVLREPDVPSVLAELYRRGVRTVFVEGGPTVAGAFVAAGMVDAIIGYVAPALLGAGPAALGPAGMMTIAEALRVTITDVTLLGDDVRIMAEVDGGR